MNFNWCSFLEFVDGVFDGEFFEFFNFGDVFVELLVVIY